MISIDAIPPIIQMNIQVLCSAALYPAQLHEAKRNNRSYLSLSLDYLSNTCVKLRNQINLFSELQTAYHVLQAIRLSLDFVFHWHQ